MTELINKKSTEKAIKKALEGLKTVVAEDERATGKWIDDGNMVLNGHPVLMCSRCKVERMKKDGAWIIMIIPTRYCPNCGALMCE